MMLKYFQNSMLRLTLEANPLMWAYFPQFNYGGPYPGTEPNLRFFTIRWLFATLLVMIDDGTNLLQDKIDQKLKELDDVE